jgi:hypothetical protein
MWKRLLAGFALGVAALAAGVAVVPKAPREELAFINARETLGRDEQDAGDTLRRISDALRRGQIDETEFARGVQSEVVPIWERMTSRLESVQVPAGSLSRREWEQMYEYVRTRRDAYKALAEPTTKLGDDEAQIERYERLIEQGDRAAEGLRNENGARVPGK